MSFLLPKDLPASPAAAFPDATGELIARTPATAYRAYRSKLVKEAETTTWVQVDLGRTSAMDAIRLYPAYDGGHPLRFKIEVADDAGFQKARMIADRTGADFPDPHNQLLQYDAGAISARYVRVTATRLRQHWPNGKCALTLAKIEVRAAGKDIAELCPVTCDLVYGNRKLASKLTRRPRPMGEFVVTDHPQNVTPSSAWKPVANRLNAPRTGVTLHGGVFQKAMEQNIAYLLESYSADDLVSEFRDRAGKPNPSRLKHDKTFWIGDLAGSNAGRFLMGAGNTLRWMEHAELKKRLEKVVDVIEECREANGNVMAFPTDTMFFSERGGYTRAWLTHGLIEAGYGGNKKAFELLRGYYDWFDRCPYLPELMRRGGQGVQGMIANARMYFTPVGRPEDLQVLQRHYQENYWLDGLAARDEAAVWQYPYDRPHCYLLTDFEAYLDLYRATGERRYLDAMLGGWDLYHQKWEHVGGTIAIVEEEEDPPLSYRIHGVPREDIGDPVQTGELCGSVFWALFNQRLHYLFPERERYVAEIEKSIYNAVLSNQEGSQGIAYHARLVGGKEKGTRSNSCCEGQGTRMLGALPEFIYSLAPDGISVELYEPSTIRWSQGGQEVALRMRTEFPCGSEVGLELSTSKPVKAKIRIRVPGWAARKMAISVNGDVAAVGVPGEYVTLDRNWASGDRVTFTLPLEFKLTRYVGVDQIPGKLRYALEYGPILMAAVGDDQTVLQVSDGGRAEDLLKQVTPKPGLPLSFTIEHHPTVTYMPYWQVRDERFTCFPVIEAGAEA